MQTIGEKLEESRKRQGISIRDAAETTKIRADFLVDFENNRFDQDLPDLYKRGFIKLYAKFLKLDAEKMATDFNALQIGYTPGPAREGKDSLGRVEVDNYASHYAEESNDPNDDLEQTDTAVYWKIAIALGVVIAVLAILILFINLINTDSEDVENPTISETGNQVSDASSGEAVDNSAAAGPRTIILIATGNCHVRVRDSASQAVLFSGSLIDGQRKPLEITGRVEIVSTETENIQVEKADGKRLVPSTSGLGKFFVE